MKSEHKDTRDPIRATWLAETGMIPYSTQWCWENSLHHENLPMSDIHHKRDRMSPLSYIRVWTGRYRKDASWGVPKSKRHPWNLGLNLGAELSKVVHRMMSKTADCLNFIRPFCNRLSWCTFVDQLITRSFLECWDLNAATSIMQDDAMVDNGLNVPWD